MQANEAVREWALTGEIILEERGFVPADLDNVFLAVVATSSRDLNQLVYDEARSRGILCNVVDVPEQCDFYYPAVVQRGDLQIAISTSGQSPSLAQKIRQQLEKQFGPGYAAMGSGTWARHDEKFSPAIWLRNANGIFCSRWPARKHLRR